MKIAVDISEKEIEALTKEVVQNLPEYSQSFVINSWNYEKMIFKFTDYEGCTHSGAHPIKYTLTKKKLIKGMKKYLKGIAEGKWPGNFKSLQDARDAGNWDASAVDGLVQMAALGEIIYG